MTIVDLNGQGVRNPSVPGVDMQFVRRWSPRAMSGERLEYEDLAPLFEAARWAPSSFNAQPWRFLYSLRDDAHWKDFFDLLVENNQGWAKNAGALIVIISRSRFERNDRDSVTHSFDAGAAWMSFALQARHSDLVAHGMQGFDYGRARKVLAVPDVFRVEAMVVVGRPGDVADLDEKYLERERPSDRKPLEKVVMAGKYTA